MEISLTVRGENWRKIRFPYFPILSYGKTVIVITHKREILSEVDQIVVLKEGRVTSIGRYDELTGTSDELRTMMEMTEQRGMKWQSKKKC